MFDRVLVAVGRRPNSSIPGLDSTRVKVNERGFIVVDEQLRTDEPSIFAIGDVVGEPMLAHKASHEGRVAVEVIAGENVAFEPRAIPAVVFTDPELAWCGLTEAQAQKDGRKVAVAKFPWGASGRAITLDRTDGLTKLISIPRRERILGVGLVGPGAGELIAEGRAGDRDGRERDRPEAVDPPAPDADRNDDGIGRGVLRPGDARLPAEALTPRRSGPRRGAAEPVAARHDAGAGPSQERRYARGDRRPAGTRPDRARTASTPAGRSGSVRAFPRTPHEPDRRQRPRSLSNSPSTHPGSKSGTSCGAGAIA